MAQSSGIQLAGKETGTKELGRAMDTAPLLFRGMATAQLKRERNSFVGKRGADGIFTRKIMRKKLSGDRESGTWSRKVAKLFRGKVSVGNAARAEDIKLGMGLFHRSDKDIFKALELFQTGGTVTSSGLMIIPAYYNLNRIGVKVKTGSAPFGGSHSGNALNTMIKANNIVTIRRGGRVLFYNKTMLDAGKPYSVMFFGVKRVTVKKQFDFIADWSRRIPKVVNRLQKSMDRGVQKFNKMRHPK